MNKDNCSSLLTTVELFAGIGGFRLAADKKKIQTLWANDINPQACKVYQDRFGKTELCEGNIYDLFEEIPLHDMLTAGFPCQPFSSAGKKAGTRDPRGTLFEIIVKILKIKKPKFFVLENVKRLLSMEQGIHFATIINALAEIGYFIEWRLINAMHFGLPQNRQRIFIIGVLIENKIAPYCTRLADASDLQELTDCQLFQLETFNRWTAIEKHSRKFPTWGMAKEGKFIGFNFSKSEDTTIMIKLKNILETNVPNCFDFTDMMQQRLQMNLPVNRFVQGVEILSNQGGGARMGYTVFGIDGVAPTLTATTSRHYERYKVGNKYRRLTNVEYARIQGFPDDHCQILATYNQYFLFGNAVPPVMAKWAMDRVAKEQPTILLPFKTKQLELFTM